MTTDQNPIKKPKALRLADAIGGWHAPAHASIADCDQAAATLRTQHALLERALQALNAEAEWCISGGDTPSGITLSAIAALNQHLDQK